MDEATRDLLQQLHSAGVEERIAAVRRIIDLPVPSMALFRVGLGDEDWRVRKAGAETFLRVHHAENYTADVIELLHHHDNAGLRNAAIEILVGLGALAVPELQREFHCPDVEVRKFIIDILGEIGDPRCAQDLIEALGDADINIRYAAVETLGKLQVRSAAEPMLALMSDPDPGLKFTVLQALSKIGGQIPLEKLFLHLDDRLLRKTLFDCFGRIGGSEVVPPLVAGLTDPMRNVREAALNALFNLLPQVKTTITSALLQADRERIADFLETLLGGEDFHLKQAALALYAAVAKERNHGVLLNCVADERLRVAALAAFKDLGAEAYSELLDSADRTDPQQHLYLTFVGGELGFHAALPLAREAVSSEDPQLRYAAARALGELGSREDIGALLALLEDTIPDIQDVAATAMGTLGKRHHHAVLTCISDLFADPDATKRMRVLRILSLIDGPDSENLLLRAIKDSAVSVRCEAIRALKGLQSEATLSGLILALTDESADVRRLAVAGLAYSAQPKVFETLKLAFGDADFWVRAAVMRAMENFPPEQARDLLLQGVSDPVGLVTIAALETATQVLPEETAQLLEKALAHEDMEVVKAAMGQLGRLPDHSWLTNCAAILLNHPHWDVRAQAAKMVGPSALENAAELLRDRLMVEEEGLVRQALQTALNQALQTAGQNGP